jgi:glyoxylase-like metal-dependent hydrolase (beta-lactamase superfamily II)
MSNVQQLRSGLWQIDTHFLGLPGIIASYLLAGNGEVALVDTGPSTTIEALLAGVHAAGFALTDVTHLLLTHIHLDHAGASGSLTQRLPNATVYVHEIGAPHLMDPTKLIASAERIYGAEMERLWGTIEPVPAERIKTMRDNDVLAVAGRRLNIVYAPGHATHQVAFHDPATAEIFCGDAAGVRLQGVDYVRPPTPPPELNLEDWSATIDRLLALNPRVLYLAHFGPTTDAPRHFTALRQRLYAWGELVLAAMRAGKDEEGIREELINRSLPELQQVTSNPDDLRRYEIATNYRMTVQGYMRYYRKVHPELLDQKQAQ